jgi:hypothetical protein
MTTAGAEKSWDRNALFQPLNRHCRLGQLGRADETPRTVSSLSERTRVRRGSLQAAWAFQRNALCRRIMQSLAIAQGRAKRETAAATIISEKTTKIRSTTLATDS